MHSYKHEILRFKIPSQDSYSNEDVSACSDSDFNILKNVIGKTYLVDFSEDNCSTLAGFLGKLYT